LKGNDAYHAVRRKRLGATGERNGLKPSCIDLRTESEKA